MSIDERCGFLLPYGMHAAACGVPAVVILWWPRAAWADTPCCFRHAHEAARLGGGARWEWLTTRVVRRPQTRGVPLFHAVMRELQEIDARLEADIAARLAR